MLLQHYLPTHILKYVLKNVEINFLTNINVNDKRFYLNSLKCVVGFVLVHSTKEGEICISAHFEYFFFVYSNLVIDQTKNVWPPLWGFIQELIFWKFLSPLEKFMDHPLFSLFCFLYRKPFFT